jgi:hypothetical protein
MRGPASWLPKWIQFLRPNATGRMAGSKQGLYIHANSIFARVKDSSPNSRTNSRPIDIRP